MCVDRFHSVSFFLSNPCTSSTLSKEAFVYFVCPNSTTSLRMEILHISIVAEQLHKIIQNSRVLMEAVFGWCTVQTRNIKIFVRKVVFFCACARACVCARARVHTFAALYYGVYLLLLEMYARIF